MKFSALSSHASLLMIISLTLLGCQTTHNHQHTIAATDPAISTMGRTQIFNDTQIFGFPGVSFFVEADGTHLSALMSSSTGNTWIDVIVDDEPAQVIAIPQEPTQITLFENRKSRAHQVRITHRSENWQGQTTLHQLQLIGRGFLAAPALPQKKLLVLGDSVTCGEAIDRDAAPTKSSRWWNARESYGALTAAALDMQVQLVCWGGRGLVRSWNGKTDEGNLADFYPLARGNPSEIILWDQQHFSPDIIVSAIGTNDFSQGIPAREQYVSSYLALIAQLTRDHPKAIILLTEGAILNGAAKAALRDYLQEIVSISNSPNIIYRPSSHHPGSAEDAHPTRAQHRAMADALIGQLRSLSSQ